MIICLKMLWSSSLAARPPTCQKSHRWRSGRSGRSIRCRFMKFLQLKNIGTFGKKSLHSWFGRRRSPSPSMKQLCRLTHFSSGRTGPGEQRYNFRSDLIFCRTSSCFILLQNSASLSAAATIICLHKRIMPWIILSTPSGRFSSSSASLSSSSSRSSNFLRSCSRPSLSARAWISSSDRAPSCSTGNEERINILLFQVFRLLIHS